MFVFILFHFHLQSAELLNSKLPKWQETCGDATKVPEKVMNMIEEIKTPISTPLSGTPQPSPVTERSSVVGARPFFGFICVLTHDPGRLCMKGQAAFVSESRRFPFITCRAYLFSLLSPHLQILN